eukprot:m.4293 g.4293  ORF g.4293 m.4293 type:complete len:236 (+) comp10512_c0_seq1:315-1022(+)
MKGSARVTVGQFRREFSHSRAKAMSESESPHDDAGRIPHEADGSIDLGAPEISIPFRSHCHGFPRLNLDVTAFVAYSSCMTNGCSFAAFREACLRGQAQDERSNPVVPVLDAYFHGKLLVACETAVANFRDILQRVGGAEEKARGDRLLERVGVVPDHVSQRAGSLKVHRNVKAQSKIVFGTGDYMGAVTVTANVSFVRAAAQQGVHFNTFVHGARALTERRVKTPQGREDGGQQ